LKFIPSSALPKFAEKSEEEIRATIAPKLLMLTAAGLIAALGYILLAPLFFRIFFPEYMEAVPYSQLYAVMMLGLAGNVAISALIGQGKKLDLYLLNIITPIAQILLQLFGVIWFGLTGLVITKAIAVLLSGLVATALLLRAPRRTPGSSHV
jgi:O-antigen/teichoic acid export membrane protein